jgi:hypothetical protein
VFFITHFLFQLSITIQKSVILHYFGSLQENLCGKSIHGFHLFVKSANGFKLIINTFKEEEEILDYNKQYIKMLMRNDLDTRLSFNDTFCYFIKKRHCANNQTSFIFNFKKTGNST